MRFTLIQNPKKRAVVMRGWLNPHAAEFTYQRTDDQHLLLKGALDKESLEYRLTKQVPQTFLLRERTFHWITEDSYNH